MDVAVGFLLENLKESVMHNLDLISGAGDTAQSLCDDLDWLKSYVKKCREDYKEDDLLKELANNVRRLIYGAEDIIEKYIATVSRHQNRTAVRGAIHAFDHLLEIRNIGKELRNITQEVQKLISGKVNLGTQLMKADSGPQIKVKKPVYDENNDMVGFQDAMKDVIGLLEGGSEDFQTISIFGMLGLGKTTLARNIFKHPTVEYKFFVRAFVEVSQDYKPKEVFLKIIKEIGIGAKEMDTKSEEDLIKVIRDYLANRNYLIVLDDVWKSDAWDNLKRALPPNQKHSRVLITTRQKNLAEYAKKGNEPYDLRFLSDDESRELLRKKVFGEEEFPSELESVEKLILNRCDCLPLSIVVVAGILINHRKDSNWWRKVAKDAETYNLAKTEHADIVIKLSFNNLPYHLKPCFLYLGVFPEDYEIPAKILLQLWVSEGFVPLANGEESSEDRAEGYLEELVDRSLVMVGKRRLNGRIKSVRIHDTLREFCKVHGKNEQLFREIKMSEQSGKSAQNDDFRLCINSDILDYISNRPSGKYVRSFLSFAKESLPLPVEHISHIPKGFKAVRLLDIRSIKLTRFPAEIYNHLLLLKFLAMSSNLKIIPEKMSNLRYLQTIIFITTESKVEIKADIWKMAKLRHLVTNVPATLAKTAEALTVNSNLHTLTVISAESCTKEVFDRAKELKKLAICGSLANVLIACSGKDSLFDCLQQLELLENLKLLNDNAAPKVYRLPTKNSFPTNLTRLTLKNTKLGWAQMSTLGELDKLEVLKLKDDAFVGEFWKTDDGSFPALKVLHITNSTDLVSWSASASPFPKLAHLYLVHCGKLQAIPPDLIKRTFQFIQIYCCNAALVSSARKLVLAKLQGQAQDKINKGTTLKLAVYPPED